MAKRRISEQQKRRIAELQQQRRLKAKSNSSQKEKQLSGQGLGDEQSGQVISHFGQSLIIEDAEKKLFRCVARQNIGALVCGDNIIWQQASDKEGVIVAVKERQSLLQKPGFGGKLKPMAANIDQIVIVSSLTPEPKAYLIDRYLVAAENLPATAIILLNKIDLLNTENKEKIKTLEHEYNNIGYPLIKASNINNEGFDELHQALKNKTSIFVGLSGVGKSSLIMHLLPEHDIRIGDLSAATGEGKHTTTSSMLYHLPCGGKLIDSPGVRDFGLWNSSADDILYGFKELRPFIGHCKFSNCSHKHEPGCAILAALERGDISAQRYEHYQKMIDEYAV